MKILVIFLQTKSAYFEKSIKSLKVVSYRDTFEVKILSRSVKSFTRYLRKFAKKISQL